jgi:hypothetical protein
MIQQSHSLGYNQRNVTQVIPEAPAHPCLLWHYSQIAKLWKQPRHPTTDKWIKKMWYLYTMEFYSTTKNEILSFISKWIKAENII